MNTPDKIVELAGTAQQLEVRLPDAAALLIDAAALIATQIGMDITDLHRRLDCSAEAMRHAAEAVDATGAASARKQ